ncbi:hypothetical protein FNU76_12605 [Chitinimonas arctica]|uniref:Uncharacterized protein n=1 Tax=Chitinimonas arctica TaxID=2594795 RepID=A0A516SG48_9NEIS|nr:hypothetical protein [Chitinimonas arctica]QDQ27135.1 hypothetical protein FNU76_12605 [Chitinimonas arctica]
MEFAEVQAQHFSTLSRDPFPHVLIERALLQLVSGEGESAQFRRNVLAAAGWPHSSLISFGKYPDQAATAFNRIRLVLAQSEDPATILAKLKQG